MSMQISAHTHKHIQGTCIDRYMRGLYYRRVCLYETIDNDNKRYQRLVFFCSVRNSVEFQRSTKAR